MNLSSLLTVPTLQVVLYTLGVAVTVIAAATVVIHTSSQTAELMPAGMGAQRQQQLPYVNIQYPPYPQYAPYNPYGLVPPVAVNPVCPPSPLVCTCTCTHMHIHSYSCAHAYRHIGQAV